MSWGNWPPPPQPDAEVIHRRELLMRVEFEDPNDDATWTLDGKALSVIDRQVISSATAEDFDAVQQIMGAEIEPIRKRQSLLEEWWVLCDSAGLHRGARVERVLEALGDAENLAHRRAWRIAIELGWL